MTPVVNIAAYKFVELHDLPVLRSELAALCASEQLKGTILLSREGINIFVAGLRAGIDSLLALVRAIPDLTDIDVKESYSRSVPFVRMVVKIKKEIIPFGVDDIDPTRKTSRRISAKVLKQWLDEGRPVRLVDTRNRFEVDAGTFEGATSVEIDDFRQFPDAVSQLPADWKNEPVVTFCTGGIRCEKAAPYLERQGFSDVYQLDGGILKYFEQCGGQHFRGNCFVFDQRVALDSRLRESGIKQCFTCQSFLSVEEQNSPEYVRGLYCPKCYRDKDQHRRALILHRESAIQEAANPLPGSVPYDNVRPISVPLRLDGWEMLDFLEAMRTHLSLEDWRVACEEGRLVCRGVPVRPGRIVRSGERLLHHMPATREPDVNASIKIVDEDEAIVVVNKPAPLPMHPCGRFNRNSLTWLLDQAYKPLQLRPAHRLDADTTGLVVFSKTGRVARQLQPQFDSNLVSKSYIARVIGCPESVVFECHEPISVRPGSDGIRLPDKDGATASTRFRIRHKFSDGTTLVEAIPITGRTNQIRIHLWSLGWPIVGDPVYLPHGKLVEFKSLSTADPPLCLHSAAIEFTHPVSNVRVRYTAPVPDWAQP